MQDCIEHNKPTYVLKNLIVLVHNKDILLLDYNNIKSNKYNMTSGTDPNTPDGMNNQRILRLLEDIKNNIYKFPNVRRTWIPKPGKKSNGTKKTSSNMEDL